jgi:hypothetical protein
MAVKQATLASLNRPALPKQTPRLFHARAFSGSFVTVSRQMPIPLRQSRFLWNVRTQQ